MGKTPLTNDTHEQQEWCTFYANGNTEAHVIPCNADGQPIAPHYASPSCPCHPSNREDSPGVWFHGIIP
jgi:hypothetical protein